MSIRPSVRPSSGKRLATVARTRSPAIIAPPSAVDKTVSRFKHAVMPHPSATAAAVFNIYADVFFAEVFISRDIHRVYVVARLDQKYAATNDNVLYVLQ